MYLMFYHIHTLNVSIIYYSLKVQETYHGIRYGLHWQVSLQTKCQLGNMIPNMVTTDFHSFTSTENGK